MITFSYYDYLFISSLVSLLSYVNYQRFKQTYNPENITEANEFYIYEQTFAFDPQHITDKQERTLTDYIKSQGGQTTVNREEADFIVSRKPPALQTEHETVYVLPLVLIEKIEQNGSTVPQEFKNQFKL